MAPAVAQVRELAVDAPAVVAQVRELAVYPPAVAAPPQLSVCHPPRPISAAPSTADPDADAPEPPSGCLRVVVVRVALQLCLNIRLPYHQPRVPRMQVILVDRPVRPFGYGLRVRPHRPPVV